MNEPMTWDPDLRRCRHERVVLVEGGYEREWEWDTDGDFPIATFYGLESFSDEGDGTYRLRCKHCLADLGEPEDEWQWD